MKKIEFKFDRNKPFLTVHESNEFMNSFYFQYLYEDNGMIGLFIQIDSITLSEIGRKNDNDIVLVSSFMPDSMLGKKMAKIYKLNFSQLTSKAKEL